jgi:hypothetical protein
MRHAARYLIICAAAFGLSACMMQTTPQTPPPADPGDGAGYVQSPESAALARYYTTIEARLVADGLLRSDGGVADAPYTAEMLAANFERIALYDEYILSGGRFMQRETPSQLRRWEAPVQLQAHFGASVDALQQAEDLSILSTYARRLSRASGHPIITVQRGAISMSSTLTATSNARRVIYCVAFCRGSGKKPSTRSRICRAPPFVRSLPFPSMARAPSI